MTPGDGGGGSPRSVLRYLTEYLCSLNLAWALVWVERTTHKTLGGSTLVNFISRLVRGLEQFVVPTGGHTILDQLIWSLVISVFGFCLLRALSGFPLTNLALRTVAGGLAIVVFPVAMRSFSLDRASDVHPIEGSAVVLMLEIVVVLICGVLFLRKNRLVSGPRLIALLLCHFVLWAWMTSSYINVFSFVSDMRASAYYHPWGRTLGSLAVALAFRFGFPVLGFLASLSWVLYVDSTFPQACKTALSTSPSMPSSV
jgi:hypothetical protein